MDLSPRNEAAATQSLKLFGKTLLVVDSSGQSSSRDGNSTSSVVQVHSSEVKNDHDLLYVQFPGNTNSATPFPWLSLRTDASYSAMEVHSPTPIRAQSSYPKREKMDCDEQKEGSSSDSNNESVSRKEERPFSSYKLSKRISANCRRGFVPYKRCFMEQDSTVSSTESNQERENQRIRLCL